jgi:hypothetical protein
MKFCIDILNKQKCLFFNNGDQEGKNRSCLGVGTVGRGRCKGKRARRVNMVEILCTHV